MKLKSKFSAGISALRANFLGHKIPLSVSLKITFRCNLKCVYCVFDKLFKTMPEEMTTDQIKHVVDELKSLGTQSLSFTGGEPLLRKDIGEIIDYCQQKDISTYLATNGTLLVQKVDEIKNLDTLMISLDGQEQFHDSQRGQGSFKAIMEGIEAVKKFKNDKLKVWFSMVVTKKNKDQIDYIIDLAEKNNFLCNFNILMTTATTKDGAQSLKLSPQEVKDIYRHLLAAKKAGRPIAYSKAMLEFYYNTGGVVDYSVLPFRCWAGRLYCVINPNGDLYPCADLVNVFEPRNCLELGFKKAFETMPTIPDNCKGCTYTCYSQKNLLFSLNWNSLMYILKNF